MSESKIIEKINLEIKTYTESSQHQNKNDAVRIFWFQFFFKLVPQCYAVPYIYIIDINRKNVKNTVGRSGWNTIHEHNV